MTAKQLELFKCLSDERKKKSMIEMKKEVMFKKVEELSLLCDVQIGIVFSNQYESDPVFWPSKDLVKEQFKKFFELLEHEKQKTLVVHENYLKDIISDEMKKIREKEREIEMKEMNVLMNQIIRGKNLRGLDLKQLKGLYMLAGEKMHELEKKKQVVQEMDGDRNNIGSNTSGSSNNTPLSPTLPLFHDHDYNIGVLAAPFSKVAAAVEQSMTTAVACGEKMHELGKRKQVLEETDGYRNKYHRVADGIGSNASGGFYNTRRPPTLLPLFPDHDYNIDVSPPSPEVVANVEQPMTPTVELTLALTPSNHSALHHHQLPSLSEDSFSPSST